MIWLLKICENTHDVPLSKNVKLVNYTFMRECMVGFMFESFIFALIVFSRGSYVDGKLKEPVKPCAGNVGTQITVCLP